MRRVRQRALPAIGETGAHQVGAIARAADEDEAARRVRGQRFVGTGGRGDGDEEHRRCAERARAGW